MAVGCPFITCAVKKKGLEFCWDCEESQTCETWKKHREAGEKADSFTCYQKLESNIAYVMENGVSRFDESQKARERLLRVMLQGFNEGRSKTYYCIASTVLEVEELKEALAKATQKSKGKDVKGRSKILHSILDGIAAANNCFLKLRK